MIKKMSLIAKIVKFLILYLIQAVCLWAGLELSTYFQGDALKILLEDYWMHFYAFPLLTTFLIFKEVQDAPLSAVLGCTERHCIAAYAEGRKAWRYNQFSFYLRRRWTLYIFISSILLFLAFHTIFAPDFSSLAKNSIIAVLTVSFFSANFFNLRNRTLRSLDRDYILHQLAHHRRDEHSKLFKKLSSKQKASPDDCLLHISNTLEVSREYLKKITQDKTIELAVRLAFPHQEEQGNIVYTTIARTKGLHNSEWSSEPIAANEGIPRCLIEDRNTFNVLIYRDIKKAVQAEVFTEITNDTKFSKKISALMVAPLKAWDGNKKSMIGILYATSGKKKAFREEHIDSMRFIADQLSDTVSFSITANHMLIVKGNKNARRRQLLEKY
ncbi:MAG: hypothetical protein D3924_04970 [Candidatus Electrothrix sp. AR4]|nr:hypothetical protein [Candidatus Electrothrix sp. AR4]